MGFLGREIDSVPGSLKLNAYHKIPFTKPGNILWVIVMGMFGGQSQRQD